MLCWWTLVIGAVLVGGLTACSGSSRSALPSECTRVARLTSSQTAGQKVDELPADLVPDSIEQVSVSKPPQLKGGRQALHDDLEYPSEAEEEETGGVVHVTFLVDTEGRPQNLKITRGAGYHLNQAALNAVRRQEFEPGTRNGRPICVPMTLPIRFRSGWGVSGLQ